MQKKLQKNTNIQGSLDRPTNQQSIIDCHMPQANYRLTNNRPSKLMKMMIDENCSIN